MNQCFLHRVRPFVIRLCAIWMCGVATIHGAETLKPGDAAPNFKLKSMDGKSLELAKLTASGRMVLVMLRGWPGYQCPICDRQVQDFIKAKAGFDAAKARVVFVYPGPADGLTAHAREFQTMKGKQWPEGFLYLLDPDYTLTQAYGLRWDAPRETAYPATFIIDASGKVTYAKVSRSHGGRTTAAEVLEDLQK